MQNNTAQIDRFLRSVAPNHSTHKEIILFASGCTPSVQTVSRMAVAWNIPHITYVGTDESLGNKVEFSILTRLSYNMNVFAKFYVDVFDAFEWTDIANIYDEDEYLPNLVGTSLQVSVTEMHLY